MNSIFKLKTKEDKNYVLDDKCLLSLSGDIADRSNFANYITRNI